MTNFVNWDCLHCTLTVIHSHWTLNLKFDPNRGLPISETISKFHIVVSISKFHIVVTISIFNIVVTISKFYKVVAISEFNIV